MLARGAIGVMKQTLKLWSIKGHLNSCCPAYRGAFAAKVVACNRGAAKSRLAAQVRDRFPAYGIEAPLVAPIIRYTDITLLEVLA